MAENTARARREFPGRRGPIGESADGSRGRARRVEEDAALEGIRNAQSRLLALSYSSQADVPIP